MGHKSFEMIFEGIYLDNINLFIPWDTEFDRIKNYGTPKHSITSNQTTNEIFEQYLWNDIEILGLQLSTFGVGRNRNLKLNTTDLINSFTGWINGFNDEKILVEFNNSIKEFTDINQLSLTSRIDLSSGYWLIRNIKISLLEIAKHQTYELSLKKYCKSKSKNGIQNITGC